MGGILFVGVWVFWFFFVEKEGGGVVGGWVGGTVGGLFWVGVGQRVVGFGGVWGGVWYVYTRTYIHVWYVYTRTYIHPWRFPMIGYNASKQG